MKERWRQDTNYPRKQLLEQAAGSAKDDEGADAYFSPFLSFSSFPFSRSLFFFLPLSFFSLLLSLTGLSLLSFSLSLSTLIVYVYFTVSIFVCFAFVVLFFLSQVSLLSHFSLVLSLTLSRRFYICFSFMHHALGLHVALAYWTPYISRKFNQSNLVKFSGSNLLSIKFNHSNFCHVHCLSA